MSHAGGESEEDNDFMTSGQQVNLLFFQAFSSLLSLYGSASIVYIVLVSRKWRSGLYHRLIFGLSISDILFSTNFLFSPYLQPASDELLGSVGTITTCSISGFFLYSVFGTVLYNFSLSLCYFLTVCHNVNEADISRRYEKWMHAIPVTIWLAFGAVGFSLDAFNSARSPRLCDVNFYPTGCDLDGDYSDCTRGLYTNEIGYFGLAVVAVPAMVSIFLTYRVHRHVQRQFNVGRRHSFSNRLEDPRQRDRQWQVASQAVMYSASFLNSFLWPMAYAAVEDIGGLERSHLGRPAIHTFVVIATSMAALQGLFNFFVFIRPRYLAWRKIGGDEQGRIWAVMKVYSGETPPRRRSVAGAQGIQQELNNENIIQASVALERAPSGRATFDQDSSKDISDSGHG